MCTPMEEWKGIDGFPGYKISSMGRVRGPKKLLSLATDSSGYLSCVLWKDSKGHTRTVHRLVCSAFHTPIEGKLMVDHIDRNKLDNSVSNLRWSDRSEQNINRVMPPSSTSHKFIYEVKNAYRVRMRRCGVDKCFPTLQDAITYRNSLTEVEF